MKALVDEPDGGGYTPYALSSADGLAGAIADAGLSVVGAAEVPVTWAYADDETAIRALLASAGGARSVSAAGEPAVRRAVTAALAPFRDETGGVAIRNVFRYVVGAKA